MGFWNQSDLGQILAQPLATCGVCRMGIRTPALQAVAGKE